MRPSRTGVTLVELLITIFFLVVFVGAIGQALVLAYSSYQGSTSKMAAWRGATIALDRMSRELKLCKALYAPSLPDTGGSIGPSSDATVVFRRFNNDPTGDIVVAYQYNVKAATLTRFQYDPGFDPAVPDSQVVLPNTTRLTAGSILGFQLTKTNPATTHHVQFLQVQMAVVPDATHLLLGIDTHTLIGSTAAGP